MTPPSARLSRKLFMALILWASIQIPALAQPALVPDEALMRQVMPGADSFTPKAGDPLVYRA